MGDFIAGVAVPKVALPSGEIVSMLETAVCGGAVPSLLSV